MDIRDERLLSIVEREPEIERLGSGFQFTEGPVWHPYECHLTFSDIIGDQMFRWFPGKNGKSGTISSFRKPSNMANGNTYDQDGRLLTCEHAKSRVIREEADGSKSILATHYRGKELNSPNDIVVKSDGWIYFTDPPSGRSAEYGIAREQELDFQGFFRMDPDGKNLELLADDFERPNGLCFSSDESRLFVNDTFRRHIRVFYAGSDGIFKGGDVWAEVTGELEGVPDGMKVDRAGNLYCTGPGGIHVFDTEGICLGVIRVPEPPANFTWGGDDMRSLFITARTSLYHLKVKNPGIKLF